MSAIAPPETQALVFTRSRRWAAEALGTAFLLAVVVGSGIMGERLADGAAGLALLANTIATGAGLVVLITAFGPISGAHFNPAVSLVFLLRGALRPAEALGYVAAQAIGALVGVWAAHAMFGQPVVQVSAHVREGAALWFSEAVATFGLVGVILAAARFRPQAVAMAVGLYITAAYWFTASTAFANPAVTLARAWSDTFAGIAPASAPGFLLAQLAGSIAAWAVFGWLLREERP